MKHYKVMSGFIVLSIFIGCSQKSNVTTNAVPVEKTPAKIVQNPWEDYCRNYLTKTDGIYGCQCVYANSIRESLYAKDAAVADARTSIAFTIENKTKALLERYKDLKSSGEKQFAGENLDITTKQIANISLRGSKFIDSRTFKTEDGKYITCAVVYLPDENVKQITKSLAKQLGMTSPRDEDILYQEFKAFKAQQRLDKELSKE